MKFGELIQFNECFSLVHDTGCCGALCTCNARAICESSDFGKFLPSDVKIGTMIKFREYISVANVTRCLGASCTCARANWKGTFVVKQSLMLKLPKWYIYDFGPRQCLAMPASSDKSADALA